MRREASGGQHPQHSSSEQCGLSHKPLPYSNPRNTQVRERQRAEEERRNEFIHHHALPRASCAGNEQVRHLRKIGSACGARNITAEGKEGPANVSNIKALAASGTLLAKGRMKPRLNSPMRVWFSAR
jgi:hypothetical protein